MVYSLDLIAEFDGDQWSMFYYDDKNQKFPFAVAASLVEAQRAAADQIMAFIIYYKKEKETIVDPDKLKDVINKHLSTNKPFPLELHSVKKDKLKA